jgi:hypothetical protein
MMRFSTGKNSTTSRIIAATYPIHVLVHELRQLGLALEVTKYASSDPTAVESKSDPTAVEKLHRVQRHHLRRRMNP